MPIKEIMALGMIAVGTIFFTYGPQKFRSELRKAEFRILKEVSRTDNWGNPDIFQYKHVKRIKKTKG